MNTKKEKLWKLVLAMMGRATKITGGIS